MWIPKSLLALIDVNRDLVAELKTDNTSLRAKNEVLERELTAVKINSDWLRFMFNQLTAERTQLIAKAYPGISLPTPEITRAKANQLKDGFDIQGWFEDRSEESPNGLTAGIPSPPLY